MIHDLRRVLWFAGQGLAGLALLALFALQLACSPGGSKPKTGAADCLGSKTSALLKEEVEDAQNFPPMQGAEWGTPVELSQLGPLVQALESGDGESILDEVDSIQTKTATPSAQSSADEAGGIAEAAGEEDVGSITQSIEGGSSLWRGAARVNIWYADGTTSEATAFAIDDQDDAAGSHFMLTTAHTFLGTGTTPRLPVRVTVTDPITGTVREGSEWQANPHYVHTGQVTPNDYGLLWFRDVLPRNIFPPLRLRTDYEPASGFDGCPWVPMDLYGMARQSVLDSSPSTLGRQRRVTVRGIVRNGNGNNLQTYPSAARPGDSGGPGIIMRIRCPSDDYRVGEGSDTVLESIREAVGVIVGGDTVTTANGTENITVVQTINQNDLRSMLQSIRDRLYPIAQLPPNASPSEVGDAIPTPTSSSIIFPSASPNPDQAYNFRQHVARIINEFNELHGQVKNPSKCP